MKCLNPKCSEEVLIAGLEGYCSAVCRLACAHAVLGSPEGSRVRAQPKPPAVTDVAPEVVNRPITKSVIAIPASKPVAGNPVTATHPDGSPKLPPLWMRKELAMKTPKVLEENLPMAELMAKFQRAKDYNRTMPSHHQTTEDQWKLWLTRSNYDHKLSRHVFPSLDS